MREGHQGRARLDRQHEHHGWNAWRISRDGWAAVLVPEISRLMFYGPTSGSGLGTNLLRENRHVSGTSAKPGATIWAEWPNFGGLVGWIGPQHGPRGWERVTRRELPPATVDAGPATAVQRENGGIVMLHSEVDPHYGVSLMQTFELLPGGQLSVTAELRPAAGTGPLWKHIYPWLVVQVPAPTRFEVAFRPGKGHVTPQQGGMPPAYTGDQTASASFGVSRTSDHKLHIVGADSLAAMLGTHSLRLEIPGAGDTAAVYTSRADGYGELEAMGVSGGAPLKILLSGIPHK